MGYTNYWTVNGATRFPKRMISDLKRIIAARPDIKIDDQEGGEPIITQDEILFNGADGNDYETFHLNPRGFVWNDGQVSDDWFCKTAYRPYDIFVKAALILGKKYGVLKNWSFDGDKKTDDLYKETTKIFRRLKININTLREDEKDNA